MSRSGRTSATSAPASTTAAAPNDLLDLIIEVSGEHKKDKGANVATARTLWVPAVNNHGGFGLWAFVEVGDPWDGENIIGQAAKAAATGEVLVSPQEGLFGG